MAKSHTSSAQTVSYSRKKPPQHTNSNTDGSAILYIEYSGHSDSDATFNLENDLRMYARTENFSTRKIFRHQKKGIILLNGQPFLDVLLCIMDHTGYLKIDAVVVNDASNIVRSCSFGKIAEFLRKYNVRLFEMGKGEIDLKKTERSFSEI